MSHTSYLLQATWTRSKPRIRWATIAWRRSHGPESTRSKSQHVLEIKIKWMRSKAYLLPSGAFWSVDPPRTDDDRSEVWSRDQDHQTYLNLTDRTAGGGLSWRSRSDGHAEARSAPLREDTWSIGFQSDGVGDSWKNITIAVLSNHDRAIEPRLWILQRGIDSTILKLHPRWIAITIKPRSWPDRGAIVARSWCDRGLFWG